MIDKTLPNWKTVRCMEYDSSDFMKDCVKTWTDYAAQYGYNKRLIPADTPFLAQDHKLADSCRPLENAHYTQCPYCKFTYGLHIPRWKGNTVKDIVNLENMTLAKEMSTVIGKLTQTQKKERQRQNS